MLTLALVDRLETDGGKDATIPEGGGERISTRAGQREPEIMTVSRVDERERELCRRREGGCGRRRIGFHF